jgi:RNA polymerase sigma-70 factor (ECF subfamily)
MDPSLVVQAQQGDRQAFESLTVANHTRLFKVAYGILRDRHLAEDATQQAFFDIWRGFGRLRDPAKFEGWSYRLLVRACYAEAKRRPDWVPDGDLQSKDEPRAGDAQSSVADRDLLERGFRHLSVEHRTVIVLRYLLDMTPEQVADTLDIPRKTVYSRLKRAVIAMRAAVEADTRPSHASPAPQEIVR